MAWCKTPLDKRGPRVATVLNRATRSSGLPTSVAGGTQTVLLKHTKSAFGWNALELSIGWILRCCSASDSSRDAQQVASVDAEESSEEAECEGVYAITSGAA